MSGPFWRRAGVLLMAVVFAGCDGSGGSDTAGPGAGSLEGLVQVGAQPVSGARVELFQAGGTGYGTGALSRGSVTTDAGGHWSLPFTCARGAGSRYYVLVDGGSAGHGANAALALMAALGPCPGSLNAVTVNELTTVAATYALSPFLDSSARAVGTSSGNAAGLATAFAMAANLADPTTGRVPATLPATLTAPTARLDTLANLTAACTTSTGAASAACVGLLTAAPSAGGPSSNVRQALLQVTRAPARNVATLYGLAPAAGPYLPALTAVPGDWLLMLAVTGGGLAEPTGVAVDASGNVWAADYRDAVSKFAGDGRSRAGTRGFTGGGLHESYAIALDAAGNAWVTNQESPAGVNSMHGSVTKLAADGSVLSVPGGVTGGGINFPESIAVDPAGNVWIGNFGDSTVSELSASGAALSPAAGFAGGGLGAPVAITVDSAIAWVSDQGSDGVTALNAGSGAALSPSTGFTGGGLASPYGVCLDAQGDAWVLDFLGDAITVLSGSSALLGAVLSGTGGFTGGGLDGPTGCAIDGAGRLWVTNFHGTSVSEFDGIADAHPGTPESPASGYLAGTLALPFGIAVDPAGSVWIADSGNDRLLVLVGAATPVKTPLAGRSTLP